MMRLQGSRPTAGVVREDKKVHEGVRAMLTWQGTSQAAEQAALVGRGARKVSELLFMGLPANAYLRSARRSKT
jgi:hypothetical protein